MNGRALVRREQDQQEGCVADLFFAGQFGDVSTDRMLESGRVGDIRPFLGELGDDLDLQPHRFSRFDGLRWRKQRGRRFLLGQRAAGRGQHEVAALALGSTAPAPGEGVALLAVDAKAGGLEDRFHNRVHLEFAQAVESPDGLGAAVRAGLLSQAVRERIGNLRERPIDWDDFFIHHDNDTTDPLPRPPGHIASD